MQATRSTLGSRATGMRTRLSAMAMRSPLKVGEVPQRASQRPPLFERLGGGAAVKAAVTVFYKKVLADDRVNHYFKDTDMAKQHAHQAAFMSYAFGGAKQYAGKDMVEAHKHLIPHLNDGHFDAIVEHFVATLEELGVKQDDIDDAAQVVETTRQSIVHGY